MIIYLLWNRLKNNNHKIYSVKNMKKKKKFFVKLVIKKYVQVVFYSAYIKIINMKESKI